MTGILRVQIIHTHTHDKISHTHNTVGKKCHCCVTVIKRSSQKRRYYNNNYTSNGLGGHTMAFVTRRQLNEKKAYLLCKEINNNKMLNFFTHTQAHKIGRIVSCQGSWAGKQAVVKNMTKKAPSNSQTQETMTLFVIYFGNICLTLVKR